MEPIVGAILDTVGEHVDCHRNFQNDVNDLRKRVADLKLRRNDKVAELQIVDDSEKQVKEEVQGWLEDARRVIEIEMPDIEEEVQNVSKLSRGSLGRRVRQKIQEVREIYDRGCFPEGLVIERPPPIGITLPTENMVGEVDVKEQIWGYLGDNEVGIIGVYGIGGVGKTTLMKHIHNELLKEGRFDRVIWVTVSQSLNVVKLQGDIASKMKISLPQDGDELDRASILMDIMKTEKYVLILDDVWDKFSLQRVGIPKPTTENGCKIVITSRSKEICNYLGCHRMVKVQPLSKQESLNLFLDKVGRDIQQIANLDGILENIVNECAGLPLAIVVIAGGMKGVEDIHEWRNALRELRKCVVDTAEGSRDDEIFNRLKFSYDRLPNSNIRNCFLYCSLYPEDWEINRARVIEDWICQGLIEELGSRQEMHDKGHTILNRLENNCLVEKGLKGGCVKMHDVMRDMALHIKSSGPSKFMVKAKVGLTEIPQEIEQTEDLEKVSLMSNEISYIPENMSPKCSMLSTLVLEYNRTLRQIPECFFANIPLLKFLNLSCTDIWVLPNSIRNLKNLTAMILHQCRYLYRMPSLAKLNALRKLDLCNVGLRVVPEGIEMLANLQYLDLCCHNLEELPTGMLSNLSRLQYLRMYKLSTEEILRGEVATLKKLEVFKCGFCSQKDFNCFFSKSKQFLGGLNHYMLSVACGHSIRTRDPFLSSAYNYCFKTIDLVECNIRGEDDLGLPDDLEDLKAISCDIGGDISIFMKNITQLQRFSLLSCKGIKWLVSSSSFTTISPHIFSNLTVLHVYECPNLKKLFPCELLQGRGLRNLEEIYVTRCYGMEEIIGWEEEGEGNQTTTTTTFALPKLRRLGLGWLSQLKTICPERGVMVCDSLNYFSIGDCKKVKRIPFCLGRENGQPSLLAIEKIFIKNPEKWWESVEWENPDDKNVLLPLLEYGHDL
ncbi:hypothetical protein SLA2020_527160 [Shorea laevis]